MHGKTSLGVLRSDTELGKDGDGMARLAVPWDDTHRRKLSAVAVGDVHGGLHDAR